jgi:predicted outer membrane protein
MKGFFMITPVPTAFFITNDHRVLLFAETMDAKPFAYRLEGRVLTVFDKKKWQVRAPFVLSPKAAAALDAGAALEVAETDETGLAALTPVGRV